MRAVPSPTPGVSAPNDVIGSILEACSGMIRSVQADHSFTVDKGYGRITCSDEGWVVTYVRDGSPREHTFTSKSGSCPDGADLEEMIAWVLAQPWAHEM